jgi:hypothetical protein
MTFKFFFVGFIVSFFCCNNGEKKFFSPLENDNNKAPLCPMLFVLSFYVIHDFTFFVDFNCQRRFGDDSEVKFSRALCGTASTWVYSFLIAFLSPARRDGFTWKIV